MAKTTLSHPISAVIETVEPPTLPQADSDFDSEGNLLWERNRAVSETSYDALDPKEIDYAQRRGEELYNEAFLGKERLEVAAVMAVTILDLLTSAADEPDGWKAADDAQKAGKAIVEEELVREGSLLLNSPKAALDAMSKPLRACAGDADWTRVAAVVEKIYDGLLRKESVKVSLLATFLIAKVLADKIRVESGVGEGKQSLPN